MPDPSVSVWKRVKAILKKSAFLREIKEGYGSTYQYGYIHSRTQVRHLLKWIQKKAPSIRCPYDPKKKDQYIFIGDKNTDSSMRVAVFGDIDLGNVREHDCTYLTCRILKNEKLRKYHSLFFRLQKKIPMPMKQYWDKTYTTFDAVGNTDKNTVFVFMVGPYHEETFSQPLFLNAVNQLSEKTWCRKVMYLVDPVDKYPNLTEWFPYFDCIATYSKADAEKYHLHYIDSPCVTLKMDRTQADNDIQIRCINAGRGKFIESCCLYLEERGIMCDFHLQSSINRRVSSGMEYTTGRKSYPDTVREELSANVLLEVLIPGVNSGPTLRYKEAVIYHKKLLTNNPAASELPCFNPENMKMIQKPEDIDIQWVKERSKVQYEYHQEFSVDRFCDSLMEIIKNE